jgi:hypothetical protein
MAIIHPDVGRSGAKYADSNVLSFTECIYAKIAVFLILQVHVPKFTGIHMREISVLR